MSSSTRLATSSKLPQSIKRVMSDAEPAPQDSKKLRRSSSTDPSTRRDSNRDTKRRRRKKKKTPIVNTAVSKNETMQSGSGQDERPRASLSSRNEIIRFTSAPPEANLPVPATNDSPLAYASRSLGKCREDSCQTLDNTLNESMPSTLRDKKQPVQANIPPEPSSSSLEGRVAQLERELKSKNALITSHQALLNQVQQAVTCQVCLDLMYKPYALAPCGHIACHGCLVNWFTAPPPDNRPAPPAISRKKTCPHCRAIVRERPVEIWGVKNIAQAIGKSGLVANQLPVPEEAAEGLNANRDPWKDIFPKTSAAGQRGFPWFFPGVDIDDEDDVHGGEIGPGGEDVGMLDMEDGGIYRCLDCMHEIWNGVCTSCGRVYPGHRHEEDEEDEGDPMGWLEEQMGAEEVDVEDDPGWMGLEGGEADDDGDVDEWQPFPTWRSRFHMFREPWFLGTIHVDEEDDDGDEEAGGHVSGGGEESDEEGYESSFIDDGEETGAGEPRIYEVVDDDDEYEPDGEGEEMPRIYEAVDDDDDDEYQSHEEEEEEGYWS